jgi:large subunit ribosomal protein L29
MEAKELRELSDEEIRKKREELREEIFRLRLKRATSQLDSPMKLRQARRDLARVETVLREREKAGRR